MSGVVYNAGDDANEARANLIYPVRPNAPNAAAAFPAAHRYRRCSCAACDALVAESRAFEAGERELKKCRDDCYVCCSVFIAFMTLVAVIVFVAYIYVLTCQGSLESLVSALANNGSIGNSTRS